MNQRIDGSYPDASNLLGSEARQALNFMERWDGLQPVLTPEDIGGAATYLERSAEELFVSYADFTGGKNITNLTMERAFPDGSLLFSAITSFRPIRDNGGHSCEVKLTETDASGIAHQHFIYNLERDGLSVRRIDFGDMAEAAEQGKAVMIDTRPPEKRPVRIEAAENTDLEIQMGVNHQPVGGIEIEALVVLLNSMRPKKMNFVSATVQPDKDK